MNSGNVSAKSRSVKLHSALLCGVSLIAWGSVIARPQPARAQTISTSTANTVYPSGQSVYVNTGVVLSGNPGIYNATITPTIGNQGTIISLGETGIGIYNTVSIGVIDNVGTVFGQTGISDQGETNGGIGTLVNAAGGTISGSIYGVYNNGTLGTLVNAAGATIASLNDTAIQNQNWLLGTLTNNGVITGRTGMTNFGTIGALTNAGTLSGRSEGISNYGTIGTLTNSGAIVAGTYDGIFDDRSISTLNNSGLITGAVGLYDYNGTIGVIDNTGTISSTSANAFNGGNGMYLYTTELGALNNAGTISGLFRGIYDQGYQYDASASTGYVGSIGTLTNSGVITGGTDGIENQGLIGALSNSGSIEGGQYGILNDSHLYYYSSIQSDEIQLNTSTSHLAGSIASLTNSGVIVGNATGVFNGGDIGTLTNSGVITGGIGGIYDTGAIGTISNTGLISGPQFGIVSAGSIVSAASTARFNTEAAPVTIASIDQIDNSGTISGGLAGIVLVGSGTTITNAGTIAGGDYAVAFNGDNDLVLTTGSVIEGTIYGGNSASQITLTGNGSLDTDIAAFGPGSALAVTPGADWTATGNWTVATLTNDGVFQPGRLGTPLNLTGNYVQNSDGTLRVLVTPTTSSQFNITGAANLAGTVSYVLAPGRYNPHTYTYLTATDGVNGAFTTVNYGEIPKGLAATQYILDPSVELVLSGSFLIPNIINPTDASIFSAQTQALAQTSDSDTASLLDKAIAGGAAASPACAAQAPLAPDKTGAAGSSARMASTLASVFCGAGGWVEATGALDHANSSGGAPAYNANTAGFLAGVDKLIGPAGTRLGFAVGYDKTYLSDKAGGGGQMGTTRVALYGAQPVGAITLAGVIAYGNASNSTSRATGAGNLSENNSVSIWSGGLMASTTVTLGKLSLIPAVGLRVASVGGGSGFNESASGLATAFAVSGKTSQYNSVQPYALIEAKQSFLTASRIAITPDAKIGYEYEAGNRGVATTLVGDDGTIFQSTHNDLDQSDALLSAGIAASKNNWTLFATYTAHIAGNWNDQTAEAGLRVTF